MGVGGRDGLWVMRVCWRAGCVAGDGLGFMREFDGEE